MHTYRPGKKPAADQPGRTATPIAGLHAAISRSAVGDVPGGRGQSLAVPVTEGMGARLGGDFSHVPVSSGSAARAAAAEAGARAYTCGSHVVIGDGYADKHTLAQELALATRPAQVQAKLAIGEPGDKYEQEADQVAAELVRQMNAPPVSGPPQTAHRQTSDDRGKLRTKPMAQSVADGGMAASPELEKSIRQARGGGQPLAGTIRESMEEAFGADFSGVKVHTDVQSDQLNQVIQARAFTTGQDVFFRQGEYQPGSREGQALIAHELTHTVQQADRMRTHLPHGQSALRRELNVTSDLVQRVPIGGPPHNYTAKSGSKTFKANHLAANAAGAEAATLKRGEGEKAAFDNTVLIQKDAQVRALVLEADYDAAEHFDGPVWLVPIVCPYIIVRTAVGDGKVKIRKTENQITGAVWVKVYFDEVDRKISVTGVFGQV